MNKPSNYMSKDAAIENLKRFFSEVPTANAVSVKDIFIATGRDLAKSKQNKSWLANKLTAMRDYDLVVRHYSSDGKKKLEKLSLTPEGKKALGRAEDDTASAATPVPANATNSLADEVTPETVYRAIKVLREKMPSFEIVFEIKPKD
ncbi:MAG TPA: hypothetical protein VLH38_00730 [Patescibacteria group bacterium]|nr:hypothetical protein [Patescibacteria group bacterium]